jgi:signal transduction histidine kinase
MLLITPRPTSPFQEERLLEGVAREVVADIGRFFSKDRVQRAAMQDERVRLARELHDGVLQSLTGAALQLEALSRLVEADPKAARERLRNIEELITEEQRELRSWIQKLKPATTMSTASRVDLSAALEKLCQRVQRDWGLHVVLTTDGRGAIPRTLGDEIYRLVQEALTMSRGMRLLRSPASTSDDERSRSHHGDGRWSRIFVPRALRSQRSD